MTDKLLYLYRVVNEKLYGLALCGGNSSRMGTDKCLLNYHGKAQCYHVHDLLHHVCRQTFISCNATQLMLINKNYPVIEDNPFFKNNGPISGLLSAFQKFPGKHFLVIACDYPFLDGNEIKNFVAGIRENATASAFYDEEQKCYQPVLAYYAAVSAPLLFEQFSQKNYSLHFFLESVRAQKHVPKNRIVMRSVDTVAERNAAIDNLRGVTI